MIKGGILMKCIQSRVCTLEEILKMIREDLPQSVGIVLFGADGDFKKEVYAKCIEGIPNLVTNNEDGSLSLRIVSRAVGARQSILEVMEGYASANHNMRHQTVLTLRNLGIKTVVGIYAKVEKEPIRPLMSSLEKVEFDKRVAAIEQSNPTADGLDYFIVVEEEKEG